MAARADLAAYLSTAFAGDHPSLTVYDHAPDVFAAPCLILHRTAARFKTLSDAHLEWEIDCYIVTPRALPDVAADTQDDIFMDLLVALHARDNVTHGELGAVETWEDNGTTYAQSVLPIKVKE